LLLENGYLRSTQHIQSKLSKEQNALSNPLLVLLSCEVAAVQVRLDPSLINASVSQQTNITDAETSREVVDPQAASSES